MSATLVSSNTTLKVNAAVSYSNPALATSGTIYTAPANGYAIINLLVAASGSMDIQIAGRRINNTLTINPAQQFWVGPSQSVTWSSGVSQSAGAVQASGVEFVNTP